MFDVRMLVVVVGSCGKGMPTALVLPMHPVYEEQSFHEKAGLTVEAVPVP